MEQSKKTQTSNRLSASALKPVQQGQAAGKPAVNLEGFHISALKIDKATREVVRSSGGSSKEVKAGLYVMAAERADSGWI